MTINDLKVGKDRRVKGRLVEIAFPDERVCFTTALID